MRKFKKYLEENVAVLCNEKNRLENVEKKLISVAPSTTSFSITSSATTTSSSIGLSTVSSTMIMATLVRPTTSSTAVESATTRSTLSGTTMSAALSSPCFAVRLSYSYCVKLPTYKSSGDAETFGNRLFEQCCITHTAYRS